MVVVAVEGWHVGEVRDVETVVMPTWSQAVTATTGAISEAYVGGPYSNGTGHSNATYANLVEAQRAVRPAYLRPPSVSIYDQATNRDAIRDACQQMLARAEGDPNLDAPYVAQRWRSPRLWRM